MAADPTEFPKSGMALLAESTRPDHAMSSSAPASRSLKAINLGYSASRFGKRRMLACEF